MENGRRLWPLFYHSLVISACTFGGGFVIVTLMKRKYVEELHWLTEEEMLDFTALAQSAPGAIAVNAAVLVGWKIGGLWGMLTAVLGTILPPMVILTVLSYFYAAFAAQPLIALALRGMQAGAAAVIMDVALSLCGSLWKSRQGRAARMLLLGLAFCLSYFAGVSAAVLILAAATIGIGRTALAGKGGGKA